MGWWMLISEAVDGCGPGAPWGEIHAHALLEGFPLPWVRAATAA